ncbi:hypothetical protein QNH94_26155, partial [Klebsiella pneumoniae]|nr:hypothetical protein [Klebsiella pneumoniae]
MSSAAGALNGMAVGFGALSPVLIGFILSVTHNSYFLLYILKGIFVIGGSLLHTSPSPLDRHKSRLPSSARKKKFQIKTTVRKINLYNSTIS